MDPIPANPQPQNIGPVIPGQPQTSLGELLGAFPRSRPAPTGPATIGDILASQQASAPAMAPQGPQAPSQPMSSGDDPEIARQADKIMADLQSSEHPRILAQAHRDIAESAEDDPFAVLAKKNDPEADPFAGLDPDSPKEHGKPMQVDPLIKLIAGMPKTAEGRLNALKNRFGADKVKYDGDTYEIQTTEGTRFLNDTVFDSADMLNFSGNIMEGAAAAAPVMATAGAVSDLFVPAAAVPINMAISATGAFGASYLRDLIVQQGMKIEEAQEYSASRSALWSAGIDLGANAAFGLTGKGVGMIREAVRGSMKNRTERAVVFRLAMDEVMQDLKIAKSEGGFMTKEGGRLSVDANKVGTSTMDAMEALDSYLGARVGLAKNKALSVAKQKNLKFQPEVIMRKFREIIGDRALEDQTGRLILKEKTAFEEAGLDAADVGFSPDEVSPVNAQLKLKQAVFGGDPNGSRELRSMVEQYNSLRDASKAGGIEMGTMLDVVDFLANKRNFNKDLPVTKPILAKYGELYNAATSDRNQMMRSALEGTPEGKAFERDFLTYSKKIDVVGRVKAIFENNGSMKKALDLVLIPGNPEPLKDLARLVGRNSKEMDAIRGYWLSERINEAIDPARPFFDGDKFLKAVDEKAWGKETLNILYPDRAVLNETKAIAKQAQRLNVGGLWKDDIGKLGNLVSFITVGMRSPTIAVRNLFCATRANPELAYWLSQEGLAKMAAEGKFSGAASEVRKGIDIFEAMVNSSREVTIGAKAGRGAMKILVPISQKAFQAAFRGQALDYRNMAESVGNTSDQPQPDLGAPDTGPYYTPDESDPGAGGRNPQGSFDQRGPQPVSQSPDGFRDVPNPAQYQQTDPTGGEPQGRSTELPQKTLLEQTKEAQAKNGRKPSSTKKRKK